MERNHVYLFIRLVDTLLYMIVSIIRSASDLSFTPLADVRVVKTLLNSQVGVLSYIINSSQMEI